MQHNNIPQADIRASTQILQTWKSEGYRTALEAKGQQVLASLARPSSITNEDVFLSLPLISPREAGRNSTKPLKEKVQTRGDVQPNNTRALEDADVAPTPSTTAITVPKKAHATFRYMFPET
jgi:hypothetical protein